MKKLEELKALEKSSNINLAYTDIIADKVNEVENTRKRILKSRLDGRYFYHEMRNGEVVQCFEMALSWEPFDGVKIFVWTPDDLHICEMDSRRPGAAEYKPLQLSSIVSGMRCWTENVTVKFLDDSAVAINGRRVPVTDESGYVYKLLKSRIKASGGARGLFRFLEHAINANLYEGVFSELERRYG